MVDRCAYCNIELPDKIKRFAIYCNGCYDKGIMLYNEEKKKKTIV